MRQPPDAGAPALEVRDLEVRYGDLLAVDGACLDVAGGELGALLGPSGCGKSSLLRAVAGVGPADAGTIRVGGRTVADGARRVPAERRRVGLVFQEGALFPHRTVWQNVAYGVPRGRDVAVRVASLLEQVELGASARRYPAELSGGQQQRVAIARALAAEPDLLLLDEPFAHLDAGLREQVRDSVVEVLRAAGTAALLVSHDREEALAVAARVHVMAAGRILQSGSPEELYRQPADLTVARFVGEGQLVSCRVRDGRLVCALGQAETAAPDGPGTAWLRPEDLTWSALHEGTGVRGIVRAHRYFGHDRLDFLDPEDGSEPLLVRSLATQAPGAGSPARVRLRPGSYPVFRPAGLR